MIAHEIPVQNFEIVRDRIATILKSELVNQVAAFYNTKCDKIKIFADRTVPIGKEESAVIIISVFKGDPDIQFVGQQRFDYQYLIRIMTNSPTTAVKRGDELSGIRLQQIIGIARYILMHPIYLTLGFEPGFIEHTEFSTFQIYIPETETDATADAEAQAIFKVRCPESAILDEKPVITQNTTNVKLALTDLGFEYQFEIPVT